MKVDPSIRAGAAMLAVAITLLIWFVIPVPTGGRRALVVDAGLLVITSGVWPTLTKTCCRCWDVHESQYR